MNRLQGKHVLITGASQGLGRQLAISYAREGAAGLSIVARNGAALDEVRARIREVAPETKVVLIVADLNRQETVERVIATTLAEFGGKRQRHPACGRVAMVVHPGARAGDSEEALKAE